VHETDKTVRLPTRNGGRPLTDQKKNGGRPPNYIARVGARKLKGMEPLEVQCGCTNKLNGCHNADHIQGQACTTVIKSNNPTAGGGRKHKCYSCKNAHSSKGSAQAPPPTLQHTVTPTIQVPRSLAQQPVPLTAPAAYVLASVKAKVSYACQTNRIPLPVEMKWSMVQLEGEQCQYARVVLDDVGTL
jgi:hypothetical protein